MIMSVSIIIAGAVSAIAGILLLIAATKVRLSFQDNYKKD